MKTNPCSKVVTSVLVVAIAFLGSFANAQNKASKAVVAPPTERDRAPILLLPGEGQPDGEQNRWKVTAAETLGAYSLRYSVQGAGAGPEFHTHTNEDEGWYVLQGELSFQVGDRLLVGSAGSFVFAPRGTHHRYWNSGTNTAKFLMMFSPGGLEKMFQERRSIPGRDPSKTTAEQSAEWKEKSKVISTKYGVRDKAGPSGDREAILVPPSEAAVNSSSRRVTVSANETLGAFSMMEFTLKAQSIPKALNEMKEDAAWYVINGELASEFGDRKFVAPEGAFVFLPRGTGHRVWASGKTLTKYLLIRSRG
jgi:quercetin dioxygenase-like cupin family protein